MPSSAVAPADLASRCDTDSWPVQGPPASKEGDGASVSSASPLCTGHAEAGDLCEVQKQDAVQDAVVVAVALPVAAGGAPEALHAMKQGRRAVSAPGLADVDRYSGPELAADGPALRNISSHGGLEVSGGVPVAPGPVAQHPLLLQPPQQQQGQKPPLSQAFQQQQPPQQQQQHPAYSLCRSLPAQWRSQSDPSHEHPNGGVLSNSDDSDVEEARGGSGNGRRRHAGSTRHLSLRQAVEMLNNPKLTDSAIERLHELHVLDASSPASIATTLHLYCRHNCLDATALGELLGGPSPRAQAVLAHFVSLIDVRGMSFVRAMRRVLCESGFRPPGEAQKIDRFVKVLAQHFVRSNRHCAEFPTDDLAVAEESAHLLAYALLQLNTAVHNPQARRSAPPMPVEAFVAALRKPPLCTQRPELEAMYHSIAQNKLQMGEVVLESVAFKSKNRTLPDGMVVERLLRLYQSRFTTCRTYAGSSPAITTYELDTVGSSLTQVSSQSQQRELVPPQTNHWDANKRRGSFKTVQLFTFQVTCRKLVSVVPRLPGLLPTHGKAVRVELGWRTLEEASEWRSYFASRMGQGPPAPAAPSSRVSACGSLSPQRSSSPPPPWPATPPQVASGRATPTSGRTSPPPE